MKKSLIKRLLELEKACGINQKRRVARVLCDPDVMDSLDLSHIEAEVLLILPDNGHRCIGDQEVPKGSYLVTYL
jgi:hypothetical protein